MDKKYDLIVYIGRFQPPHNGHIKTIHKAFELAKHVLVLCGSANRPRTPKNPFSYQERCEMIFDGLNMGWGQAEESLPISIEAINDNIYDDDRWTTHVQHTVTDVYRLKFPGKDPKGNIAIIGYQKDESSWYLNNFPNWTLVQSNFDEDVLNATDIRKLLFTDRLVYVESVVPKKVYQYLKDWRTGYNYDKVRAEYEYYQSYDPSIYPINMVTADAVVIQSGHVLLIERDTSPGRGQLALPGGFVNTDETVKQASIRELREETGLKVPEKVLKGSIYKTEVFDSPTRSLRGRVITHVFGFRLNDAEKLPRVRGSSDARKAYWVPFAEALSRPSEFFEDHWDILYHFI